MYHFGGKDRIPSIVRALRAIGVPVVAVVDIDALADKEKFVLLYESLGGNRTKIEADLAVVIKSVGGRKGQLTGKELAIELERHVSRLRDQTVIPTEIRNEIGRLAKASSNWQRVKEDGYRAFVDAPAVQAFGRIAAAGREVGLLINSEGELEGLCRQVSRTNKSEWLAAVLQKHLLNDPDLVDARTFATQIRECVNLAASKGFAG